MRYRLRTLLIAAAVLPPLLAGFWLTTGDWQVVIALVGALVILAIVLARFGSTPPRDIPPPPPWY